MKHRPWIHAPGTQTRLEHIGQGVYAGIVDVTRPLAKEWLPDEIVWRKRNNQNLQTLVAHLENNTWNLDGNSIKFDAQANLIDGQHRLTAVVRTGIPMKTVVLMGNIEQHANLDTGLARGLADYLRQMQKLNSPLLGSLLRMQVVWDRTHGDFTSYYSNKTNPPITHELCLETLEKHPDLEEATKIGAGPVGHSLRGSLSPTSVCHVWWVLSSVAPTEAVEAFFAGVADCSQLSQRDPRTVLRKFFERRLLQGRIAGSITKDVPTFHAVTYKAWNLFVRAEECEYIRWKRLGKKPDKFPVPLEWDDSIDLEDL